MQYSGPEGGAPFDAADPWDDVPDDEPPPRLPPLTPELVVSQLTGSRRLRMATQCNELISATDWADLHPGETLPTSTASTSTTVQVVPGAERAVRLGGDGTPLVAEFAAAELAALLHSSSWAGARLIGDALDLRHRLPRLWRRICETEIEAWQARRIAQATRHLTKHEAAFVDAAVVDQVGRLPWGRLQALVDAAVIEANPERAAQLADLVGKADKKVHVGQSDDHGLTTVYARVDAAAGIWLDAIIDRLADLLQAQGDESSKDNRRATALGLLAHPARAIQLLTTPIPNTEGEASVDEAAGTDAGAGGDATASGTAGTTDGTSNDHTGTAGRTRPDDDARPGASPHGPGAAGDRGPTGSLAGPDLTDGIDAPEPGLLDDPGPPEPDLDPDGPGTAGRPLTEAEIIAAVRRLDPDKLRPRVLLNLHLAEQTVRTGTGVARTEGIGPQAADTVRAWLGDCTILLRPVIDLPAGLTPVDAYEIPQNMRDHMQLRQPVSSFPFAASRGRLDLDHTIPYRAGCGPGQTRIANLAPLSRLEHRLVTHGDWSRRQPEPGTLLFRAPHGHIYLVDHNGTHPLGTSTFAQAVWNTATPE
ncbi:DUF222 domain-containing protein [Microlunatus sp. Y2014]|uniref:DUF222 domain-containing protein n=1 Tax=Microlunatus sp. Y2014 TaxID=3418488 RepID=UPI003DA6F79E